MSKSIANPPAFPSPETENSHFQPGMTLRDYFAAKALPAFITNHDSSYGEDAENAYKAADAMLKERSK